MDEWRNVADTGGMYQINRAGQVRSWKAKGRDPNARASEPHLLQVSKTGAGCSYYSLTMNGKSRPVYIQKLLRLTFPGEFPELDRGAKLRRPVERVTLSGEVDATYKSTAEAAVANYTSPSNIYNMLNGRYKGAFEARWHFRYAEVKQHE